MKYFVVLIMAVSLAGCGGYHQAKRGDAPKPARASVLSGPVAITPGAVPVTTAAPATAAAVAAPTARPFASGPISKACMSSKRKARSRSLCGCIQAVANDTLSNAQQRLAVSFYDDPHRAQEIRQSDKPSHEVFWKDYRAYGARAERQCR